MSVVADHRRRLGVLVIGVLLGHLVLISAQVTTKSGVRLLEVVTFSAFSEIERFTATVFGGVTGAWSSYVGLRGVAAENERLRREVTNLGVQLQRERALAQRGMRLGLLLQLKQAMPLPTLAAEVIGGDASAWFQTITIDKGAADGVTADMAVLSPGGVVGRVVGTPAHRAARVQVLIDRNAGAGALVERSRAGGVVVGDGVGLHMEYVSNLADVRAGDAVVTSGLDGIYPKGLVIGFVTAVEPGSGLYKTVRLRSSVDYSSLEEVLVVTDRGVPPAGAAGSE